MPLDTDITGKRVE